MNRTRSTVASRSMLAVALAACVGSLAPTARAQDPRTEARAAFDRGVALFQREAFADALASFEEAYRLQPHPAVLVNLANCQLGLGRPVEAAQLFERYLRQARDSTDAARRATIERALGRARADIATIAVEAPSGVAIELDARSVGATPLAAPLEVNPGRHEVVLVHRTGTRESHVVTADPGGEVVVTARPPAARETTPPLAPVAPVAPDPAPEPPTAPATTPLSTPPPAANAPAAPAAATTPHASPDPEGDGLPVVTWVAGGLAVAAVAAGLGFGMTALNQQAEFDSVVRELERTDPSSTRAAELRADGQAIADTTRVNALIADVFFGTAVVAAGIGLYAWLADDDAESEAPPRAGAVARLGVRPHGLVIEVGSTF